MEATRHLPTVEAILQEREAPQDPPGPATLRSVVRQAVSQIRNYILDRCPSLTTVLPRTRYCWKSIFIISILVGNYTP